jgi:hypothetical protein
MGHSMGAAPILAAVPLLQKKGYTVPGIIVLDVVEGEPGAPIYPHCPRRETPLFSSWNYTVRGPQLTVWSRRRHRGRVVAANERDSVFSAYIIPLRRRRDPLAVSDVGPHSHAHRDQAGIHFGLPGHPGDPGHTRSSREALC